MSEPEFEWKPEYDTVLEQIAVSDRIDTEWVHLRNIIKYKVDKNISQYLGDPPNDDAAAIQAAVLSSPKHLPMGGLKLPPFAPRIRLEGNPNEAPKHILTAEEARGFKELIYKQLDDFERPPFTIQRVCELCLTPRKYYKYIGKYLRAVDKALLVTSTWDAFPVIASTGSKAPGVTSSTIISASLSTPSTPMFSPIPFLHGDARRSRSRSPPPSPLALTAIGAGRIMTTSPHAGADVVDLKAIGLVDELDDPSPGHLSDHPQPISATTTAEAMSAVYKSLGERFTKAEEGASSEESGGEAAGEESRSATTEGMAVDEEGLDDKENKST